ncbi:MAG: alpha/beta fold hydrolase [Candidatus Dormibacteraeota bacterium]|nr:alpha/beta fold hydrolase [Candidatus Dormibacteraeota bacterium]
MLAPLALVGHSFGASVALCAAAELGDLLAGLVLLEPSPFSSSREAGAAEYNEILALRDSVNYVSQVTAATHVISARDTVPSIAKIVSILKARRPDWRFV